MNESESSEDEELTLWEQQQIRNALGISRSSTASISSRVLRDDARAPTSSLTTKVPLVQLGPRRATERCTIDNLKDNIRKEIESCQKTIASYKSRINELEREIALSERRDQESSEYIERLEEIAGVYTKVKKCQKETDMIDVFKSMQLWDNEHEFDRIPEQEREHLAFIISKLKKDTQTNKEEGEQEQEEDELDEVTIIESGTEEKHEAIGDNLITIDD